MTTLSPPALISDLLLLLLCHKAFVSWGEEWHTLAMQALGLWMFVSKFIKLVGHYIRYPVDGLLLPVSILFGYLHGIIKIYAVLTLNVVSSKIHSPPFPPSTFLLQRPELLGHWMMGSSPWWFTTLSSIHVAFPCSTPPSQYTIMHDPTTWFSQWACSCLTKNPSPTLIIMHG